MVTFPTTQCSRFFSVPLRLVQWELSVTHLWQTWATLTCKTIKLLQLLENLPSSFLLSCWLSSEVVLALVVPATLLLTVRTHTVPLTGASQTVTISHLYSCSCMLQLCSLQS